MKKCLMLVLAMLMVVMMFSACAAPVEAPAAEEPAVEEPAAEEPAAEEPAAEEPAAEEPAEAPEDEYDPKSVRIAVMTTLRGNATLQTVQMGFVERATELGYDPEIITIDGSDMTQFFAAGEAAIADGVQGIVIMRDIVGLEFFKKCDAAGVPCIAVHFQVPEDSGANLFANISCLPQSYGVECADAIAAELKEREVTAGKIAITQGGFNTTENAAAEAFTAQMASKYPEYEVMAPVEEGFDSTNGMQRQAAIIQSTPDLVAAFTTTGGGAVNWANAAAVMGKGGGQIVIIGMDYTEANLARIKTGEVFALVAQPLVEESALGAEMLDAWFRNGEKPASYFNELPAPLITSENVADYDAIVSRVKTMFAEIQG